jgi:hypothetical protein
LLHTAQGVDFDAVLPRIGLRVVDLPRRQDQLGPVRRGVSFRAGVIDRLGFRGGWSALRAGGPGVPPGQPDDQAPSHYQSSVFTFTTHLRPHLLANENDFHLH